MKPVYQCDYCDHIGTEDDVRKHEEQCMYNYNRKSCWTCKHKDRKTLMRFKCLLDVEIPENMLMEFCGKYEWDEQKHDKTVPNLFGSFFG